MAAPDPRCATSGPGDVLTARQVAAVWSAGWVPRWVFAAGDVRHASAKRVASAVGEGSVAVQLLHNLFAADRMHPRLCIYGGENRLPGLAAQIEAF